MNGKNISLGKTNVAILNGHEDLSLWSEEELMRGQRMDRHGRWSGRPPKVVPTAVHRELTNRRMGEAFDLLRDNLVGAVQVLGTIAQDPQAPAKDRIRASEIIIERVLGKQPQAIAIVNEPWQDLLVEAIVSGYEDVIEAEVVDDD